MSARRSLRDRVCAAEGSSKGGGNSCAEACCHMPAAADLQAIASDPDTFTSYVHLLSECAKLGQVQQMKWLLEQSINSPPGDAIDTAFMTAAEFGHCGLLEMLRPRISCISHVSRCGEPAMVIAARCGQVPCLALLHRWGASLQSRDDNGKTALIAATEHAQESVVKWLLERDVDVDAVDDERNTAVHVASSHGHLAILHLLLENGASCSVLNDDDETPLEVADNCEIARVILEVCAGIGVDDERDRERSLSRGPLIDDGDARSSPSKSDRRAPVCSPPFLELRMGPAALLFWSAVGVGRDNIMFQQFGVYPFDRLNDTERIVILTEVCEGIAGYRTDLPQDVLRESALFAVFAMMKARTKKEIEQSCTGLDTCSASHRKHTCKDVSPNDQFETHFGWRKKVLDAYEQQYSCTGADAGLSVDCNKRVVWNTVINLLAQCSFQECFWEKRRVFSCANPPERPALIAKSRWSVPDVYFSPQLPTAAQLSQSAVQLTFKKLMTMSKSYLSEEPLESSGCFCQDCIAEREVPLTFKLQFLEESAEEKKQKKGKRLKKLGSANGSHDGSSDAQQELIAAALRERTDDLIVNQAPELEKFWSNLNTEEKWVLTEMSTHELSDIISEPRCQDWETLRAALVSYSQYQWEEDVLEINDDCVTIADDMCETKDMNDLIHVMLEAALRILAQQHACPEHQHLLPHPTTPSHHHHHCLDDVDSDCSKDHYCISDEEWDRHGRQMLESIVMAEFARKIACQYVLKSEESRAQRVALELELELLQEEEQHMRASEKKARRKKAKSKKKKRGRRGTATVTPADEERSEDDTDEDDDDDSDGAEQQLPQLLSRSTLQANDAPIGHSSRMPREARKTQAFQRATPTSSSSSARNSACGYMNGMMFICTDDTYSECQSLGIFGLPRQHLSAVIDCKPGGTCALFLFNITTRYLHGLFEPASPGADTIHNSAWSRPRGGQTPFPAQVSFTCVGASPRTPLPESAFRHIFPDGNRIRKLTGAQVQHLLQTWDSYQLHNTTPIPPVAVNDKSQSSGGNASRKSAMAPSKSKSQPSLKNHAATTQRISATPQPPRQAHRAPAKAEPTPAKSVQSPAIATPKTPVPKPIAAVVAQPAPKPAATPITATAPRPPAAPQASAPQQALHQRQQQPPAYLEPATSISPVRRITPSAAPARMLPPSSAPQSLPTLFVAPVPCPPIMQPMASPVAQRFHERVSRTPPPVPMIPLAGGAPTIWSANAFSSSWPSNQAKAMDVGPHRTVRPSSAMSSPVRPAHAMGTASQSNLTSLNLFGDWNGIWCDGTRNERLQGMWQGPPGGAPVPPMPIPAPTPSWSDPRAANWTPPPTTW